MLEWLRTSVSNLEVTGLGLIPEIDYPACGVWGFSVLSFKHCDNK